MPRHLKTRAGQSQADKTIKDFVGKAPRKQSSGSKSRRLAHIEEVRDRMNRKEWDGMTPGKLVALYYLCHERTYGTVPLELNKATAWELAMKSAGRMVKAHFDDDMGKAINFMRWVWTREMEREEWRRNNKRGGQRINWRNQFNQEYLITDWRADAMRS